ncbi:MAG: hypothetical protein ACI9U2_002282 [Bradymonadia bacterium]|jgi:hypothetical protein
MCGAETGSTRTTKMTHLLTGLILLTFTLSACGGGQSGVDKESIRANADAADRDLDRESEKNAD